MLAVQSITETWEELCRDPAFRGVPYKIETDQHGRVLMSPTKNYHAFFASRINRLLERLMADGETANELGVRTTKGVKVPDSAWVSPARAAVIEREAAASIAPEICVEVLSQGNLDDEIAEKKKLYFEAGALEVWLCDSSGHMEFFSPAGKLTRSNLCPGFPESVQKSRS